jgi:hypothetical protein
MEIERDLVSPSKLNLRFNCPGSANLEKQLPKGDDHKSPEAERGTKLHAIEEGAPDYLFLPADDKEAVDWCFQQIKEKVLDRFDGTDIKPIYKKEYQIDLSELEILSGKRGNRIDDLYIVPGSSSIVIDKKFGSSYVSPPKYNKQMWAYSWGVWKAFGGSVECIILQPDALNEEKRYQSHVFEESEFEKIGADIKAIVGKCRQPDAPLIRGDHCTHLFCKCSDICPLWRQAVLEIPQGMPVKTHLKAISAQERAKLYENLQVAEKWVKNAISVIVAMALEHEIDLDGYEIGDGKKTYAWKDEQEAQMKIIDFLFNVKGMNGADVIEPAHLKSKSEIEKLVGKSKEARAMLDELIVAIPGSQILKKTRYQGK